MARRERTRGVPQPRRVDRLVEKQPKSLQLLEDPRTNDATLLLALTGWMDGGSVSTGTVRHIMEGRELVQFARLASDPFYIYNVPGSMEIAALFRPPVKYKRGVVHELEMPANEAFSDAANNMVFFVGKEPNLRWPTYARCLFSICEAASVKRLVFIGSFGGSVPHTRQPRLFGSVSDPAMLPLLKQFGIRPSDYAGPASFATYLLHRAPRYGVQMLSLAAEVPGYLGGINPMSIEAVVRRLAKMLPLSINLDKLRELSNEWELRVSEAVEKDEKLASTVRKLEEEYDEELLKSAD